MSDSEISRIAAFLNLTEGEFIQQHTEVAPDRAGLILKSHPDGACEYLDENGCAIHPVKPDKCASFPFEWTNPDSNDVCPALGSIYKS